MCVVGGGHGAWRARGGDWPRGAIERRSSRAARSSRSPRVRELAELARACDEARLVIFAVPSRAAREAARQLGDHLGATTTSSTECAAWW